MRRIVSCRVSPAPLHVRTPSNPRVDLSRSKKKAWQMGEVEAEALEVVAAVGPSYREGLRGKTRPDYSRHPMGRNLTLKRTLRKWCGTSSVWPFFPSFLFSDLSSYSSSPQFRNFCLTPTIASQASGPRKGCSLVWQSCSRDMMECCQHKKTIFFGSADSRLNWSVTSLQGRLYSVWTLFTDHPTLTRWVTKKLAYHRLKVNLPKWIKSTDPFQRSVICNTWFDYHK